MLHGKQPELYGKNPVPHSLHSVNDEHFWHPCIQG